MINREDYELYLVTDDGFSNGSPLVDQVRLAIEGGVTLVQYRDKDKEKGAFEEEALTIQKLCKELKVPFIVNDNVEVAKHLCADGIHVGQSDMTLTEVRKVVGEDMTIGVSVSTVEEALQAQKHGADYLGVGAVFPTSTKNDACDVDLSVLRQICDSVTIPVVAIGGIHQANAHQLSLSGIQGVAVVSAILGKEDIKKASEDFRAITKNYQAIIKRREKPGTVVSIAGSDCSGGAGIQADLKTFLANDCYGMSVITALTAQNTTGVTAIEACSDDFVAKQMEAVFTDIYPDAVKIGMVASASLIETIAKELVKYDAKNIVVDPVMVATSGSKLLEDEAMDALRKQLLPLATLITPNLYEAELLASMTINNKEDMIQAAKVMTNFTKGAILVKGGHRIADADDLLYANGQAIWIKGMRVDNDNTHGTGCTLSSAIASHLAKGYRVEDSVILSKKYITNALHAHLDLGKGSGPLDHGWKNYQ